MATTVRQFNGAGDRIVFSPGTLEAVGGDTPVTVMTLLRLESDGWRTIISFEAPGADERVGLQVSPADGVLGLFTPFGSELVTDDDVAPPDEWLLVGMQRDGGEDQMIRVHVYQLGSETWAHEDTATRSDPGAIGAGGRIQVGEMSTFEEYLPGRLAVVGTWLETFSDQAIEAAGLHTALRNWLDLGDGGPASLLAFNQPTTADPVVDVVDSGVEQTALTGTTVVDDQALDLDDSLGGRDETAAAPLVLDLGFVAPAAAAAALLASAEPLALTTSIGTPEVTAAVSTTATPLALAIGGGDPETAADLRITAAPLMLAVSAGSPTAEAALRSGAAPLMLAVSAGSPATAADLRITAAPLVLTVGLGPVHTEELHTTTAAPLMLAVMLGPAHTGEPSELVPRVVWVVPVETRIAAVRGETRRVQIRA